jgi:cell division septation protein DedD
MKLPTCHVPSRIAVAPVGWLLGAALLGALQGCSMTSRLFDTHASTDTVRNAPAPPVLVPAADGAAATPAAVPAAPAEPAAVAPPAAYVNEKAAAIATRDPAPERPAVAAAGATAAGGAGEDQALLPSSADLPKGRWAARIGLFGVEANAYRQAATLRDAVASHPELPAEQRVVRVVKTGERYLVLLGDLADVQAARQLVSKVRQILRQDAIVYTR